MSDTQSWSLIVFAFNEEGTINAVLEKAAHVLEKMAPEQYEIIVVNDGSTDHTGSIADNFALKNSQTRIIHHTRNKGIGPALITGYAAARNENVCAVPADGQFDLHELLPYVFIPEHTIVSFYRRKKLYYSPLRKVLTFFNRYLNRYVLGIKMRDVNWIKIYKNHNLKRIKPAITSSLVESEICAKMLLGTHTLTEVESVYNQRQSGTPKGASFKIVSKAFKDIFLLRCEIRKYKRELKSNA